LPLAALTKPPLPTFRVSVDVSPKIVLPVVVRFAALNVPVSVGLALNTASPVPVTAFQEVAVPFVVRSLPALPV
jgi:hypothetical protein